MRTRALKRRAVWRWAVAFATSLFATVWLQFVVGPEIAWGTLPAAVLALVVAVGPMVVFLVWHELTRLSGEPGICPLAKAGWSLFFPPTGDDD
jgi:hypothetical protein